MNYPMLNEIPTSREMVDVFKGYNHNLRIGDGEFFDMKNMTSDYYPILSPRKKRGVYASPSNPQGLIAKDNLCYVDNGALYINKSKVAGFDLSPNGPKQLISMGAYIIILPDKKYINTEDYSDKGLIEAEYCSNSNPITFEPCTLDGEVYPAAEKSAEEPEREDGKLWIDTSSTPNALKKYSETNEMWVTIPTTYVKITAVGIGKLFNQYDGVTISGIHSEDLQDLNSSIVIMDRGDDYIIVTGLINEAHEQHPSGEVKDITVERRMPKMDFVIESGNRLWGCLYGENDSGQIVNEIYASKLGDFKNWNCFMDLSTDSYAASVGTDGQFTGAGTHLGYPLFFKENCVHKVYGNFPANFQIQTTSCRGVQKGCDKSLAIVNEVLYYKSRHAVCAYDGSLPTEISLALGDVTYDNAVAGANGNKYYITMEDLDKNPHLFVYDTAKGMWHKEDNLRADCFCSCRGELYCIDRNTNKIITMLGTGTQDTEKTEWMVQTGIIGTSMPDVKYISRLLVRMSMEIGARVRFFAQYDSLGDWEHLGTISGTSLRSFLLPIKPKRCDHMRIRIEGIGDVKIFSITKTIEQGSDIS